MIGQVILDRYSETPLRRNGIWVEPGSIYGGTNANILKEGLECSRNSNKLTVAEI